METLFRREPVVNRQQAIVATRLTVRAESSAAAAAALAAVADAWPAAHDVVVALAGGRDAAVTDWPAPANALIEIPAADAGRAMQLAADTPWCLSGYAYGIEPPQVPKLRFALADARQHPRAPAAPVPVLAVGLADCAAFDAAVDDGYAGAAGWFLLHGRAPAGNALNPSHAQIIHILNQVRRNADVAEIEATLKQNIAISFKLLRYINSAGFGLNKKIESFRHAVTLIGYDKLNKWLSLLLVTASQAAAASALMHTAIVRGRFMELAAAGTLDRRQLDNVFIAGSFSLLDALLGTRLDAVLKELELPPAVAEALLAGSGPYAPYLELARAGEGADFDDFERQAASLGLDAARINRIQIEALAFADSLQID